MYENFEKYDSKPFRRRLRIDAEKLPHRFVRIHKAVG